MESREGMTKSSSTRRVSTARDDTQAQQNGDRQVEGPLNTRRTTDCNARARRTANIHSPQDLVHEH
jgi:hypothetical protein